MKISMKLVYQYMAIFFNFSPTSNHLHPLQVENCDSNSRLEVDEDDNAKFRLERVLKTNNTSKFLIYNLSGIRENYNFCEEELHILSQITPLTLTPESFPINTRPSVDSMLGQRCRRWPSIKLTYGRHVIFFGFESHAHMSGWNRNEPLYHAHHKMCELCKAKCSICPLEK